MEQERTHRRFSPSQAERFFNCYGSTNLLARVPVRPPSIYAEEGINAHAVLEAALRNAVYNAKEAHKLVPELKDVELDDGTNEFYLSVQIAIDHVVSILEANPGARLFIESYVDTPNDVAPGETGGYSDITIYAPLERKLYQIDYKHGAGIAKDAEGNRQQRQYAAGFLYEPNAKIDWRDIDTVEVTIVQPRAYHKDGAIRYDTVTPFELLEYLDELNEAVAENMKPDAALTPGPWCSDTFCDARTLCPAREAMALQGASRAFQQIRDVTAPELPAPHAMDLDRLGRIRFHAPMLRKWLDEVDAHCEELARHGHDIPGAKLVETQARRQWYGSEAEVAKKLAALMGLTDTDELYRKSLVPITTAEKLVVEAYKRRVGKGKGRKNRAAEQGRQAMAYLTLKQSSGNLVLVDENDPRPKINKAQTVFAQVMNALPAPNSGDNT